MSEELLQSISRRNFLSSLIATPALDETISKRKDTSTLPVQIELIKVFYKLSRKANYELALTVPYLRQIDKNVWSNTMTIPIVGAWENGLILLGIEDLGLLQTRFEWITGNNIKYDNPNIPEVINFNGVMIPFFEMFKTTLPNNKFDFLEQEDCEIDICLPIMPIPMKIPFPK